MPKKKDLTGHRFGRLVITGYAEPFNKRTRCNVVCDCGTIKVVDQIHISRTHNPIKSCGCLHSEGRGSAVDLTGVKFNDLQVVGPAPEYSTPGRMYWEVECCCGTIKYVLSEHLRSGATKSCGCMRQRKTSSLKGQRFNRWIVLGTPFFVDNRRWYRVLCDCGTEKDVLAAALLSGTSKSCGCYQKEVARKMLTDRRSGSREQTDIAFVGTRLGTFLVLERVIDDTNVAKWKVLCDCGRTKLVPRVQLKKRIACACHNTLPETQAARTALLSSYKMNAESRAHPWALTNEQFFSLVQYPCHYCGTPPSQVKAVKSGSPFMYTGIDRINNGEGYGWDNVVPCCMMCNRAKGVVSYEAFITYLNRMTDFRSNKLATEPLCIEGSLEFHKDSQRRSC